MFSAGSGARTILHRKWFETDISYHHRNCTTRQIINK